MEVMATIETWVAAVVGRFLGSWFGGERVPIMVPRFVMNASPGPRTLSVCY